MQPKTNDHYKISADTTPRLKAFMTTILAEKNSNRPDVKHTSPVKDWHDLG